MWYKSINSKRVWVFCWGVLLCMAANAQQALVRAYTDKKTALLGEPVLLTIETRTPGNIKLPLFKIDSIAHFEFLKRDSVVRKEEGGSVLVQQYYRIISFDSGRWVIPAFVLQNYIKTAPVVVDIVFTDPFDANQPYHDVQAIRDVPFAKDFEKWWYLIAAALILITFIVYWLTAAKKEKPPKPVMKENPYSKAKHGLQALRQRNADEKTFYSGLVDVFRTYVLERTGIESLQQTSNDLNNKLWPLFKEDAQQYDSIKQVLLLCDFVKFAKYDPDGDETRSAWEVVSSSIDHIEKVVTLNPKAIL